MSRKQLQYVRKMMVSRLEELETERSHWVDQGDLQEAKRILGAFQEVANLLERFDEIVES